jgi:hypothetical protein
LFESGISFTLLLDAADADHFAEEVEFFGRGARKLFRMFREHSEWWRSIEKARISPECS